MFNLYLTEAAAETATTGNSTMSLIMTLVMYGIFIFALWFILFRPQKRNRRGWQHRLPLWKSVTAY